MRNHTGVGRSFRRQIRFLTVAIALVATAAVVAARQSESESVSFDALYRRGASLNAELKTLTARFTETTTSPILARPLEASGVIAVERPSKIVLHYDQPEPRAVLIEGDRLIMSWPGRNVRQTTNIGAANRRIQRYFVDSTPDRLRDSFDILTEEATDRPGTYKLTMVPRRSQIKEGLSRLELWLDQKSLLLTAMRMTFPGGETKLMVFDNVHTNVPVDPAVFTLGRASVPAG